MTFCHQLKLTINEQSGIKGGGKLLPPFQLNKTGYGKQVIIMTKKHLSTFEREMRDPIFRKQFEKEYQDELEKCQNNCEKTSLKSRSISDRNSKKCKT